MKDHDLLSIKEFSELTGVKQSKLRYYDDIKLFKPMKRGENGYRYYSVIQAIAINCINVMHNMNIPVKKFVELKKERTPEQILELLHEHELDLNRELFRLQQAYLIVHTYSRLIREGLAADEGSISCRWMEAVPIEIGAVNDFSSGHFYSSFFSFLNQMADHKVNPAFPAGGYYESMDDFVNAPGQPVRYFIHFPEGRDCKDAGEYLVGYTRGYYGNLGDLPRRMEDYAKANDVVLEGPVYEMYLHDEISVGDHDQYLIQVSARISKTNGKKRRSNR